MVTYPTLIHWPSQTMDMVSIERVLASAVFAMSINLLDCNKGSQNHGSMIFGEKTSWFFEIHWTNDTSMGTVAIFSTCLVFAKIPVL